MVGEILGQIAGKKDNDDKNDFGFAALMIVLILAIPLALVFWANCVLLGEVC